MKLIGGKMEITNKAIHRGILLAVQVRLRSVAVAMGDLVVVVQQMVHFLQCYYAEQQHSEQAGNDGTICWMELDVDLLLAKVN